MAPRPGIEPGTCGLTVQVTDEILATIPKNPKRFFQASTVAVLVPTPSRT